MKKTLLLIAVVFIPFNIPQYALADACDDQLESLIDFAREAGEQSAKLRELSEGLSYPGKQGRIEAEIALLSAIYGKVDSQKMLAKNTCRSN